MLDTSSQWFFEDIPLGYVGQGLSRTFDYADIVNYANFTRDYNPIHVDKVSAKDSLIGDVMLHGLIITMVSSGMMLRTEFGTKTVMTLLACQGHKEIKFLRPVLVGDTITVRFEVVAKEDIGEGTGLLEMVFEGVNQKGETVQRHGRSYLVAKRGYDFETVAERGHW